jgi:hypothetical protein
MSDERVDAGHRMLFEKSRNNAEKAEQKGEG